MNTVPFRFGKIVTGDYFVNRLADIERLKTNFSFGVNTVIISPRRWGKSSLVAKVKESLSEDKSLIICDLDLFNIRSEEDFYIAYANAVMSASASKWEEIAALSKAFLSKLLPQITLTADNQTPLTFGVAWEDVGENADAILNLAESVALKKKKRIVVCFDEFQNIATFAEPLAFQKKLRAHFQVHQNVTYCFYGSKRHMMLDVFTDASMPFYKFGDLMFLDKISETEWEKYIVHSFAETGRTISESRARAIALRVENHPYYVQQLSQQVWFRTQSAVTEAIIEQAHEDLISQLSLLFVSLTENLPTSQVEFLRAMLNNETQLTSQKTLKKYKIGTSANVSRAKNALIQKDIIDEVNAGLYFQDPIYKEWLKRNYFKM
ncbi:MAG: ATPase [Capnocytophaga sp.]|nr:ATPase [Capnocytophaga sp.]